MLETLYGSSRRNLYYPKPSSYPQSHFFSLHLSLFLSLLWLQTFFCVSSCPSSHAFVGPSWLFRHNVFWSITLSPSPPFIRLLSFFPDAAVLGGGRGRRPHSALITPKRRGESAGLFAFFVRVFEASSRFVLFGWDYEVLSEGVSCMYIFRSYLFHYELLVLGVFDV